MSNSHQMVCGVMAPFTDFFVIFLSCQTHDGVVTIHIYPCFHFGVNNHASVLYGANENLHSVWRFNKLASETTGLKFVMCFWEITESDY